MDIAARVSLIREGKLIYSYTYASCIVDVFVMVYGHNRKSYTGQPKGWTVMLTAVRHWW